MLKNDESYSAVVETIIREIRRHHSPSVIRELRKIKDAFTKKELERIEDLVIQTKTVLRMLIGDLKVI